MFQPNNYWEKRCSMLEALVLQLCSTTGMGGLLGSWQQQVEALKMARVNEVLGPVLLAPEDAATGQFMFDTVPDRLRELGLMLKPEQMLNQEMYTVENAKREARIKTLPELEESIGPSIANGLYAVEMGDDGYNVALVFNHDYVITVFLFDNVGMHAMSLNLHHMPESFDWEGNARRFWRSELYPYREDLGRTATAIQLDEIIKAIDFSELNVMLDDQYQIAPATANDDVIAANEEIIAGEETAVADAAVETPAVDDSAAPSA